jgi:hypothetical protein
VRHLLSVKENSIQNIKMSETPSAVVVPNSQNGSANEAAAVTPMKGGMVLSPLPLSGGRRKTKKLSKKVLNMFKKGSRSKLMKMMKGGSAISPAAYGGSRRKTRRHH